MAFLALMVTKGKSSKIVLLGLTEKLLYTFIEVTLIGLEGQYLIPSWFHPLLSDGFLTPHGIHAHNTPFECQELEEFREGGNLIGLLLGFHLSQHYPIFCGPSTDHMDSGLVGLPIIRAAQRLTVNGYPLLSQNPTHRLYPT